MAAVGPPEDAKLVEAALTGDDAAFSALMGRHKEPLYRFVRRYVGDADEALDLVQETFVAIWTALDRYDTARPFPVWLRRVALNKCRDWSRRRQVRRFFFGAVPLEFAAPITADIETTRQEPPLDARLASLDAAIAALPVALKEPLLLTVFEDLSHQDAATILGISAKAVETRVYRAKQRLRAALGNEQAQ
jgi:RNA polymerase sigma factor (sigma-70 family)